MAKIKIIIYYIIELIIGLSILSLMGILILKSTVYNKEYIKNKFEKYNYYENVDKEIKEEMKHNIVPTQLPETVLDNIYTQEDLKNTIDNIIDKVYTNEKFKVDTTKISENLKNNINKYVSENNINVDNQESINKIINQMTDIYKNKITQSSIYEKAQRIVLKTSKYLELGIIFLFILIPILIIITYILRREYNISLSLLIASIMDIAFTIFFKSNININNIYIWDNTISDILHDIVNDIIKISDKTTIVFIVIALLLIILKREKKTNKIKEKKGLPR